ncbi:unnamed protein product [Prorocentrum cordatum]|uniref:Glycosyl hydrolase family 30 TIM-barrel domain-containing protein n=1 Tax=Prorocentrum cordatum TaxID=2364126 RepID=A0ABN9UYX7_9DINO|nr:unnamed protein product [Polarella glacialis]
MEVAEAAARAEQRDVPRRLCLRWGILGAVVGLSAAVALSLYVWAGVSEESSITPPPAAHAAQLWQTSPGAQPEHIAQRPDVEFGADFDFDGPTVKVSDVTDQVLKGFGGAFTEASAVVFQKLNADQQQSVLNDYFGPEGLGYTLGRVHINSCDFSTENYAFHEKDGEFDLASFDMSVGRDAKALIPFIKAAQDVITPQGRSLRLLATPWSPPAWMKENKMMDHSSSPCLRKEAEVHAAWAKYFVKWITAYKDQGVPIWAVTIQNEPENNEADFLGAYLGPAMSSEHPNVSIFVYDHNKDHVAQWANVISEDKDAAKYATGVAYHWYSGDSFDAVASIHAALPQLQLLASEATYERYRWKAGATLETGEWSMGEGYAHDIIGDLNAGSVGWIDWNLLLDENGGPNHVDNVCDAAMMANLSKGDVYRHPQYYYIGHFSKFMHLGPRQLDKDGLSRTSADGSLVRAAPPVGVDKEGAWCRRRSLPRTSEVQIVHRGAKMLALPAPRPGREIRPPPGRRLAVARGDDHAWRKRGGAARA